MTSATAQVQLADHMTTATSATSATTARVDMDVGVH
jgi:hypothetical protein